MCVEKRLPVKACFKGTVNSNGRYCYYKFTPQSDSLKSFYDKT